MLKKFAISILMVLTLVVPVFAQTDGSSPIGANTAQDLYSPSMAGRGGFTTSKGGAPASALNPAAEGDAQRIIFDIGYLGLPSFGDESGYGNAINLGALFPTRVGVFGGSLRFLQSPFDSFGVGTSFAANLNAAKELYPGMNLGLGLNVGFNTENTWTASADLGFRYNMGDKGFFKDFTWAVVLRSMGKSWIPSMFTPVAGVSFDFVRLEGSGGSPDPLRIGIAADVGFPTFQNFTGKLGLNLTIAELVTVSTSSQFNLGEAFKDSPPSFIPSVGIAANIKLKSGGRRIVGGALPSDGELSVDTAAKPLYNGVWAMGGGVTWTVGVADNTPPLINVTYPETAWISPNNDGKSDALEFPVEITDQRYIAEWIMEIADESGEAVRTYRNKERRPETQGVRNFFSRLTDVKSGVEVPESMRWDGILESGAVAPDGKYTFTITAVDDNGNTAVSEAYEVMVDNTPPSVTIEPFGEGQNIFSPDGDGNKDTITITQTGSVEDLWEAGIYDAAGTLVRSFNVTNGKPEPITWNGTNQDGEIVADGVYSYRIAAVDKAQNSESAELGNIIISTVQPQTALTIGDAWFSPNGDNIKDTMGITLVVPVKEGILGWEIVIRDSAGNGQRTISGAGSIPQRIDYDGRGDTGSVLREGVYTADLSVRYRNGYVSTAVSPAFTLDITPPRATVKIDDKDQEPGKTTVFSPNNDGNKDELFIIQDGSNELAWLGEIRRAGVSGGAAVRSFRFTGTPQARLVWDGMDNYGALAPDGTYIYELSSTDPAGNTGRSNTVEFEIFTKDTPVLISTDLRSFSPNGDGVRDTINFQPQVQETSGILNWKIEIQNIDNSTGRPLSSAATIVRTISGTNSIPVTVPWNGRTDSGNVAPDGTYVARLDIEYRSGNKPTALSRAFTVDTRAPEAELSVPFTLFSPNGDGNRDFLPIQVNTEGSDEWNAVITNPSNQVVRSWNWTGKAPAIPLPWDGADQAGNIVSDGNYNFALSSTDEAGNSTRKTVSGITVDSRIPRAFLTASSTAIAPKANQSADAMRFNLILNPQEGIDSWTLELKDDNGRAWKTFSGRDSAPPAAISWNGTDDRGIIREDRYTPALTVKYTKGDVITQTAPAVTVDVSGPVLGFSHRPEYFSPDNDGVEDELYISLSARDASPIAAWSLSIYETEGTKQLFYRIEGRGSPSENIVWDGRSNKGELVQAATDYSYTYTASDTLGNSSTIEGILSTDVMVIRDGNMLKIQVPSITFRANAADFNSLPTDRVETNIRVLRRIAEILNKFRDYKITVEGHANPVAQTQKEETEELQPLSLDRAKAVIEYLVDYGVSRSRLSAVGRGGTRTVVSPNDPDNRWKNRRVEFILIK
jgi:flagellar hook assembly protein FlgD